MPITIGGIVVITQQSRPKSIVPLLLIAGTARTAGTVGTVGTAGTA